MELEIQLDKKPTVFTRRADGSVAGFEYKGKLCKTDGCTLNPIARKGPYAGLCAIHAEQAKERRRLKMKRKGETKVAPNEVSQTLTNEIKLIKNSKKQLTRAAIRLAGFAEKFEIAAEHRDEKIDEARQALGNLNESLEEFKRIAKAKLTAGPVGSDE